MKRISIGMRSGGEEPPSDAKHMYDKVTTETGDLLNAKRIVIEALDTEQFQRVFPLVDWQPLRKDVSCLFIGNNVINVEMAIIQELFERTQIDLVDTREMAQFVRIAFPDNLDGRLVILQD